MRRFTNNEYDSILNRFADIDYFSASERDRIAEEFNCSVSQVGLIRNIARYAKHRDKKGLLNVKGIQALTMLRVNFNIKKADEIFKNYLNERGVIMNNIYYGAVVYCKYRSLTDGTESIVRENVYAITEKGFIPTIEKDKQLIEFKFDDLGETWWYSLEEGYNDLPLDKDIKKIDDNEWEIVCAK